MKKQYAIDLFGSVKKLAAQLNITVHAIYQWDEEVPELQEYKIKEYLRNKETVESV